MRWRRRHHRDGQRSLRYASESAKVAFLFNRVGLAGCDMGACSILPRIIGQGRASELLYFGRSMSGEEGERWGFFNGLSATPSEDAMAAATRIANGPTFANGITKTQLHQQWNMSVDQAIGARHRRRPSACRPRTSGMPTTRLSGNSSPCLRETDAIIIRREEQNERRKLSTVALF